MSEEAKFNMIYIVLGTLVLITGVLELMTSITYDNFNDYLLVYILGILSCMGGAILVYFGLEGKNISIPAENKVKKMTDYGIVSILAGTAILIFSSIYFLDANHRYNNPFFPLANETVQSEIVNQLFYSTIGLIVGGVLLIIGFILVAKFFGNEGN